MAESTEAFLTGPQAATLLAVVHRVRGQLGADEALVRRLTRALAEAAGIPAEASPWPRTALLPELGTLASVRKGLNEGFTLRVEHIGFDGAAVTTDVEPYHVRLENGFWTLVAREAETGEVRVFRIDKIVSIAEGHPFSPRPVDMSAYLDGISVPPDPGLRATVAFGPRSSSYANQRWGIGTPLADGRTAIAIPYASDVTLARTLMEFGDDFEVLEPRGIRDAVRDRALATLRVAYGVEPG